MILSIVICAITCIAMILSILFFPKIRLGKISIDTYWIVTLIGASVLLACGKANVVTVGKALISDTAINPLKILALFLSMTILSIFLDELGFFQYLAGIALKKAKTGQTRLFLYLYVTVSILTIFTSNDVIILSFTPFICYFAKNAKIDPTPYLAAEFVAANTWSMALVIGNPTNIYLATACGVDFIGYLKISILPTLLSGIVAFLALYLLFRKKLSAPIEGDAETIVIKEKLLLWVGIAHLIVCTILLAIGSYLDLEMWLVSLCAVASLFIVTGAIALIRRKKPTALFGCTKRAPYQLIPFVLSMFVLIVVLNEQNVTNAIGRLFGGNFPILKYGISSFLSSNLINNIPMSVLFSSIIESTNGAAGTAAVFATIIGSNLGALFTPIGALAGIMWSKILSKHDVKFGYLDFLKIGASVALPTLATALGALWLMLLWV